MGSARDYDVVIVGAGAAGLAAAVTAHDAGATVMVIEADEKVGGSSRLSGGHFYAAGTSLQRDAGIVGDTPDAMFDYWMTLNQWMIEPGVARAYCDNASPTLEWLRSLGVEYKPERIYRSGADSVPRGHPPEGEGLAVIRVLDAERLKRGIDLALMTRADRLLCSTDGRVVGLEAGGETLRAGAVVIASGGFGQNREFIERYWPDAAAGGDWTWCISGPQSLGDGLALGSGAGAALDGYNRGLLLVTPGFNRDLDILVPSWVVFVSREGRRFCDETAPYNMLAGLFKRNGGTAYAIFDEASRQSAVPGPGNRATWVADVLKAKADEGRVIRADTLKDLAELAGINVAPFLGTVHKYNIDVARGRDSAYLKDPRGLRPVATPPYYAVEVRPAIICWTGTGLRIDAEARVLGADELPIPGLFAAGETVGSLHGDRYIGGGGSFGPAVTIGRIAGRSSAATALGR
jgi:fumarate reductase flavoprotein subunit